MDMFFLVHLKLSQHCLLKTDYFLLNHSVVSDSCNPMVCSPPGSSVHGIFQARILEWVAMPSARGSSPPRDWTWVSCIAGKFFTNWATYPTLFFLLFLRVILSIQKNLKKKRNVLMEKSISPDGLNGLTLPHSLTHKWWNNNRYNSLS